MASMEESREPVYRAAERIYDAHATGALRRWVRNSIIAVGGLIVIAYFSGPQFW
jgi:hypothetical protein